jgi:methyl-accepting chemotaxis protein
MQEIVNSIHGVTDIMAKITAASAEQSSGIELVNQAIAQMDEVTQQNAALVEQAAAAEALEEQAQSLVTTTGSFKVAANSHGSDSLALLPSARKETTLARLGVAKDLSVKPKPLSKPVNNDDWEEF